MSSAGAANLNAKVTLTIDEKGMVVGADNAVGQLDRIKKAANDAGQAATVLTREQDALTKGMTAAASARDGDIAGLGRQAKGAEGVTASIAALSRVQQKYLASLDQAKSLRAAGLLTEQQYKGAVDAAATSLAFNAAQVIKNGGAAEEAGVQFAKLEALLARLGATGGIAAGNLGIMRAALKAVPELLRAFPTATTVGAVVAVIGTAVVASETYQARINDLIVAERVHGNVLGLTRQGYIDLATQITATAQVSDRDGLRITAALLGKNSSVDEMRTAGAAVRDFARATGQELPAAAAAMSQAFDDPIGTLKRMEDAGNGVNRAIQQQVKDLVEQGQLQKAGAVVALEFAKANQGIADNVTASAQAFNTAKVAAQNFFEFIAHYANPTDLAAQNALADKAAEQAGSPEEQAARANAARAKRTRDDAQSYVGNIVDQLDPFGGQLRTLGNQRKGVVDQTNAAIAAGADKTKSLAEQTRALNLIDTESLKVKKAQADAALNLNEALKARIEREKSLIQGGPQAIAAAKAQASAQVELARHVLDGVGAQQKLTDQLEVEKATLPYSTALLTAKGKAAKELKAIIDALTASIREGQVAQHGADAAADVRSQFGGISGQFMSDAVRQQQLKDAKKDLEGWRDTVIASMAKARNEGDMTGEAFDQLAAKAQQVFEYQLSNLYLADTQKRKDWVSGMALGFNQVEQETADFAATSKELIESGAQALKGGFFDMILAQRNPLQGFFSWFTQSLAQMVWQTKLAGPANSLVGGLVGFLGKAFGLGDTATSVGGAIIDAPTEVNGIPVAHAGWDVGRAAAPGHRMVALNDNAPRFHRGTGRKTVGQALRAGEHHVIVEDKERISTEEQWNDNAGDTYMLRASAAPIIHISFDNQSGTPLKGRQGETKKQGDGSWSMRVIVEQVSQQIAEEIHAGNSPVSGMLEQTHGLQRRPAG